MADEQKENIAPGAAESEVANLAGEIAASQAATAEGAAESTLSQDEIDSLLGFGEPKAIPNRGVDAIISRSRDNYEKFPMLEVVFDRFSRSIATSMRSFTGENCEITVENITSIRFEDYLNSIPLPTILSIFQAVEWENVGLMTIDSPLIYSLVDILLGGGKSEGVFRVEGRPFTAIEQDIIKNFSRLVFDEMTSAFTPVTTISFRHDRLETNPRFATITRPATPVVIISCRIEFDGVGGKIDIIFPYSTLEPVKDLLSQMFAGESFGSDLSWQAFLGDELKTTSVGVRAELDKKTITLRDLTTLKVGSTLVMENRPDDDIKITCNGVKLFSGKLGSFGDNVAISLSDLTALKDYL